VPSTPPGTVPCGRPQSLQLTGSVELICFALCVAQCVYLVASLLQGSWIIDPGGQRIATDFVNVWASGRQVLAGDPADAYDLAIHKDSEVAAVGHPFAGEYPWIYPPTFLFVAALLAALPFVSAYVAWIVLTFPVYVSAVRAIIGQRAGILLACAFPGVLSNAIVGQNGFATAGLLGGALVLLERRPMLAGCCIGLLTFKPHLGILFPVVLVAGGHWRVMASAVAVTALLVLASCVAFGMESWHAFLQSLPTASQAALTEGRADWAKLQSIFAVARLAGGSVALAWTSQLVFAATVAILLYAMWRSKISSDLKAAGLATGALLVTPYLFIYDLVVLAIPMAFLIRIGGSAGFMRGEMLVIGCASFLVLIFPLVTVPLGLAATLLVALVVVLRVHRALAAPVGSPEYPCLPVLQHEARSS
jgi:arabinofuranan 3-O-arabinosyltransferase